LKQDFLSHVVDYWQATLPPALHFLLAEDISPKLGENHRKYSEGILKLATLLKPTKHSYFAPFSISGNFKTTSGANLAVVLVSGREPTP
jgi:hypothetical protein